MGVGQGSERRKVHPPRVYAFLCIYVRCNYRVTGKRAYELAFPETESVGVGAGQPALKRSSAAG